MLARTVRILTLYITLALMAFFVGREVPYAEQVKLTDALLTFSSVVFAVVGVWLAIAFPDVLTKIYNEKITVERRVLLDDAKRLLKPLLISALAAASVIAVRVAMTIVVNLDIQMDPQVGRGLMFAYVAIASISLIGALIYAVAPGLQLYFEASNSVRTQEKRDSYLPNYPPSDSGAGSGMRDE